MAVPLELGRPPQAADLDSLPLKQGPEVVPMGADTNTEMKASSLPSLTVPSCVTCLCNCCDKGSRRKGEFTLTHSLRAQATVAGRAWWSECEAAGHIASSARRQGQINAGVQPTFFFLFCLGSQPTESRCPHLGWVLPPQLSQPRKSLTDTKAGAVFPVFGDPAKLTISVNHHTSHYPRSVRLLLAKVQLSKQHPPATGQ